MNDEFDGLYARKIGVFDGRIRLVSVNFTKLTQWA